MPDFPLMISVKLPVVERIHRQSNKFATGVESKGTGDSKLITVLPTTSVFLGFDFI